MKLQLNEKSHHTGFLLLLDEMYGEEEVEVQVDLVGGLHVLLELVGGGRPEGDHCVAEPAEDGGGRRGGSDHGAHGGFYFHLVWHEGGEGGRGGCDHCVI